jgi:hypothetical protein
MFQTIYFLVALLVLFSILLTIVVGLFIGVTYLIMYFLPTVDLANTLVPAAILTMVPIVMMGNIFKQLINDNIYNSNEYLSDDEED